MRPFESGRLLRTTGHAKEVDCVPGNGRSTEMASSTQAGEAANP